jgi:hypothetical protein
VTDLAAEEHVLAAPAGSLAHHAVMMVAMMHMVRGVMHPHDLHETFRLRPHARRGECSGLRQWR